ncbi:cysteine--tRNA ligase [Candidatus Saccharibacteria bacterium]|nr:cysteine--tRNA ligase [Candidatus Saccharibacteria bacterium]
MHLHNTLGGKVEALQTLQPNVVKLYTCGLTVYSQPHIGNWLGYIYWDVLVRVLENEGYSVERTQNITDVGHLTSDDDNGEDKMEKGAKAEGKTAWDIAEKYKTIADHEAHDLLRLKRPTHTASATDYIDQQIEFAKGLESKGLTYFIDREGLYFDSSKIRDYGKLAKLDVSGLEAGKRVAVNGKHQVTDFAIWKLSPIGIKRDMEWESPWGLGFPGWHLECSAIAYETLGSQIDIHTGGIDHIPVHHTNEIAQTEGFTGLPFATTWLHNNHIKIDGTKVSKSIGNIVTISDVVDRGYDLNAFKILTLSKHYRTEGNFDWNILDAANNRLNNWRDVAALRHQSHNSAHVDDTHSVQAAIGAIVEALQDDLDTPAALAVIDKAFGSLQAVSPSKIDRHGLVQLLEAIDELLGIDLLHSTPDISDELKQKILMRERARDTKNWKLSDSVRDELLSHSIELNDGAHGTTWSYLHTTNKA